MLGITLMVGERALRPRMGYGKNGCALTTSGPSWDVDLLYVACYKKLAIRSLEDAHSWLGFV